MRSIENSQNCKRRRKGLFAWPLWLFLVQVPAVLGGNDMFEADCEKLLEAGKVTVAYTDIVPAEDNLSTVKALQSLSGKADDSYHNVYGLTHAEPEFRYELQARWRTNPDGRICMVPDVSVKLGFAAMRVYVARELQDSCRRNIVREHELEHVSAWRSHFRIGARMMEEPLRIAFSQPRYYVSQNQARADLKPWVEGVLKPFQQQLINGAMGAQRAIDSPGAYQRVTQRLRSCPSSASSR